MFSNNRKLTFCSLIPYADPNRRRTSRQLRNVEFFTADNVKQHWSIMCDNLEVKGEPTASKVVLTPGNDTLQIYLAQGYIEGVGSPYELMEELCRHCNIEQQQLVLSILTETDQARIDQLLERAGIAILTVEGESSDEEDERYRQRPEHLGDDDENISDFADSHEPPNTSRRQYFHINLRRNLVCRPVSDFTERYSIEGIRIQFLTGDFSSAGSATGSQNSRRQHSSPAGDRETDPADAPGRRFHDMGNVRVFALQGRNSGSRRQFSPVVDDETDYIGQEEVSFP